MENEVHTGNVTFGQRLNSGVTQHMDQKMWHQRQAESGFGASQIPDPARCVPGVCKVTQGGGPQRAEARPDHLTSKAGLSQASAWAPLAPHCSHLG